MTGFVVILLLLFGMALMAGLNCQERKFARQPFKYIHQLVQRVVELLTDDQIWLEFHRNAIARPPRTWLDYADDLCREFGLERDRDSGCAITCECPRSGASRCARSAPG